MNLQLGSKNSWRYEYIDLPDVKSEEDIPAYVEAASKMWPTVKKAPKREEMPEFDSPRQKQLWEEREIRRCKEGHAGMTGKMYFYYNYAKIETMDGLQSPQFRIGDAVWYHLVESCRWGEYNEGNGIICTKSRRSGFSWKSASDMVHESIFFKNKNILMTSKDEDASKSLFDKVDTIVTALPTFLNMPTSSKTKENITFARKTKDELGNRVITGNRSKIKAFAPTDSCFEGERGDRMFIDEVGKISNVLPIWMYGKPCLMDGPFMKGIPVLFGTAGDTVGVGSGQKQLWYNAKAHNLIKFFFPGWASMFVDDKGNDDIEKAVRFILDKRKELEGGPEEDYLKFVQQYPLTPREAFLSKDGVGIGHAGNIRRQIDVLIDSDKSYVEGQFVWSDVNRTDVIWVPNKGTVGSGKCRVYEHPTPGAEYVAGADPADHDYATTESSDMSMYIMGRGKGNAPPRMVFSYTDRPEDSNDYYEQSVMALIYFNKTKILIENNRYRMVGYYKDNGYIYLLKEEPGPKNKFYATAKKENFGIRATKTSKLMMEGCINDYTKDYCDLIPEIELLREFQVYGEQNTDRAMAFGWCLVSLEDEYVSTAQVERIKSNLPKTKIILRNGVPTRVNR